jgi:hypothetical protein
MIVTDHNYEAIIAISPPLMEGDEDAYDTMESAICAFHAAQGATKLMGSKVQPVRAHLGDIDVMERFVGLLSGEPTQNSIADSGADTCVVGVGYCTIYSPYTHCQSVRVRHA